MHSHNQRRFADKPSVRHRANTVYHVNIVHGSNPCVTQQVLRQPVPVNHPAIVHKMINTVYWENKRAKLPSGVVFGKTTLFSEDLQMHLLWPKCAPKQVVRRVCMETKVACRVFVIQCFHSAVGSCLCHEGWTADRGKQKADMGWIKHDVSKCAQVAMLMEACIC